MSEYVCAPKSFYLGDLSCLVVDDHKISRYVLSSILGSLGVKNVVTSERVDFETLKCRLRKPDLIVSDVRLRGHSGFDFLAALREGESPWSKNTPFILVSSDCRESIAQESAALGADGFLTKPIKPSQVYATILSALGLADYSLNGEELGNLKFSYA